MTKDDLLECINSHKTMPEFIEIPLEDFYRIGTEVADLSIYGMWLSAPIDRPNFICRGITCVPMKRPEICGELQDGA